MRRMSRTLIALIVTGGSFHSLLFAEVPPPSACGGETKVCGCNERYVCEEDGDCDCVKDEGCAVTACRKPDAEGHLPLRPPKKDLSGNEPAPRQPPDP